MTIKEMRKELSKDYSVWLHREKAGKENVSKREPTSAQRQMVKERFENEKILLTNIIISSNRLVTKIENDICELMMEAL